MYPLLQFGTNCNAQASPILGLVQTESLLWVYLETDGGEAFISLPLSSIWVDFVEGMPDLRVDEGA